VDVHTINRGVNITVWDYVIPINESLMETRGKHVVSYVVVPNGSDVVDPNVVSGAVVSHAVVLVVDPPSSP